MTFQIFKSRLFAIAFCLMACVSTNAQESSQMQALIGKSLSKLQAATPEAFLNCIAEMKRIDAMFPDSIQPKYQTVLQSLNFSVMNPNAEQTENLLAEAGQTIEKNEEIKALREKIDEEGKKMENEEKKKDCNDEVKSNDIEPQDLVKFGLIPEFIGRLPIIAKLNDLSEDDLVRILVEPKNAIIKQY